jgi:ParB-like chromosome segregation protein Spo0J/DNA repair photolyase
MRKTDGSKEKGKKSERKRNLLTFAGTQGTKEWSPNSFNIARGCVHGCRYCYAWAQTRRRFKKSKQAKCWTAMELLTRVVKKKAYKLYDDGRVMYPSWHDIVARPAPIRDECLNALGKLLAVGNRVLVTTKPSLDVVKEIHKRFRKHSKHFEFRFTITSTDAELLRFWEPGAPSFQERMEALRFAYEKGYKTSISCEPFLDADPRGVVEAVDPFTTGEIWIGIMNYIQVKPGKNVKKHYDDVREHYELANLRRIYTDLRGHEKVRWKDSFEHKLNNAAKRLPCAELLVDSIIVEEDGRVRKSVDGESVKDLAASIATEGLLQPILVRRGEGSALVLVAGRRRLRAFKELGTETIPAIVVDDEECGDDVLLQLTENLNRKSLSPLDEARAYNRYFEARLGLNARQAQNTLMTCQLDQRRLDRETKDAIKALTRVAGKSECTIWRRLSMLTALNKKEHGEADADEVGPEQKLVFAANESHPAYQRIFRLAVRYKLSANRLKELFKNAKETTRATWSSRIHGFFLDLKKRQKDLTLEELKAALSHTESLAKELGRVIKGKEASEVAAVKKAPQAA